MRPCLPKVQVLDNGVTSNEFWRILDCEEGLEWCVFYYSGAASRAGLSYSGAILASKSGEWPASQVRSLHCQGGERLAGGTLRQSASGMRVLCTAWRARQQGCCACRRLPPHGNGQVPLLLFLQEARQRIERSLEAAGIKVRAAGADLCCATGRPGGHLHALMRWGH